VLCEVVSAADLSTAPRCQRALYTPDPRPRQAQRCPLHTLGRAAYEELLQAGVEINEYQPTMLQAKTLVLDGAWASVGSVNFDNRSFQLHDEATLCVQSEELAAQLTASFEADLKVSERMRPGAGTTARCAIRCRSGH
jgi:hypothetical protein